MPNFVTVTSTGKNLATSAASAGTTLPTAQSGEVPRYVRVAATSAAYFRMGAGVQTAVAGDLLIQPGDSIILAVPQGITNAAALQVTAAGIVQISPLEDC